MLMFSMDRAMFITANVWNRRQHANILESEIVGNIKYWTDNTKYLCLINKRSSHIAVVVENDHWYLNNSFPRVYIYYCLIQNHIMLSSERCENCKTTSLSDDAKQWQWVHIWMYCINVFDIVQARVTQVVSGAMSSPPMQFVLHLRFI